MLVLGLEFSPQPINLAVLGLPGCDLVPIVCEVGAVVCGTTGIDAGYARHDFARGFQAPAQLALPVYGQWLVLVLGSGAMWPGGLSKALEWYF